MIIYQEIDTPFDPRTGYRKLVLRPYAVDAAGEKRPIAFVYAPNDREPHRLAPEELLDGQKIVIEIELEAPARRSLDTSTGAVEPPPL